jgi:hypothetical protein
MKYYSKTQHLNTSHTTPHISVPRTIIRQLLHKKFNVCNVMADDGSHAILKCCVCNNSFLFKVLEYNEMNQNNKKNNISPQLLVIRARLLEAVFCISNLCSRRARITCPFAVLLFQQMYVYNINLVSSVDKLAHRPGCRGLIPVIV